MKKIILRTALVLFVLGLLAAGAAFFYAPQIFREVANRALPSILGVDAEIGDVEFNIFRGTFALRNVRVEQPEIYGERPLLRFESIEGRFKSSRLFREKRQVLEYVRINGLEMEVVHLTSNEWNVTSLGPQADPPPEPVVEPGTNEVVSAEPDTNEVVSAEAEPAAETEPAEAARSGGNRSLIVEHFEINDSILRYRDHTFEKGDIELVISNLSVLADGMVFLEDGPLSSPSTASVSAVLCQQTVNAQVHAEVQIGPLGGAAGGLPFLHSVFTLNGVELDTFGPLLVKGAKTAIGGTGFDLSGRASLSPDLLFVQSDLVSNKGQKTSVLVGGTPETPDFSKATLLGSLLARPGTMLVNLVGNVGKAVYEVGEGATEAVGAVGQGAIDTVGAVGGGLFGAAGSLLKGDVKGVVSNVSEGAVGAVSGVAGTVTNTGGKLMKGGQSVGDALQGKHIASKWNEGVEVRFERMLGELKGWIDEQSWPPAKIE